MPDGKPLLSFLYNAPLFAMALFWGYCRIQESRKLLSWESLIDILVFVVAASRFFGSSIPPSGHALFLTHTMLTINNRAYRLTALILLIMTVVLKLTWGDYTSWIYGILTGTITAGAWVYVKSKRAIHSELKTE
jgi:hypothetical protein